MSDALKKSHANCGIYVGSINIYLIYTPKPKKKKKNKQKYAHTHTHLSIPHFCCRWFFLFFSICIDFQSTYKLWFVRKLSLLTDTQFLLYIRIERSKNHRNENEEESTQTNERIEKKLLFASLTPNVVVCAQCTMLWCAVRCWVGAVLWCVIYVQFD